MNKQIIITIIVLVIGSNISAYFVFKKTILPLRKENITNSPFTDQTITPAIKNITVSSPIIPFKSEGDLWFSTWDDNDDVFVSWGDGYGPTKSIESDPKSLPKQTHHGLAILRGSFPNVTFEVVNRAMPLSDDTNNSKPSSLLFLDGRLYVAIHYPLMDPTSGFIAYSDDYGKNFTYPDISTWKKPSKFLCRIFLNMGKSYGLNVDGYAYIYGIGSEMEWDRTGGGRIYLARVPKNKILNYNDWKFFAGLDNNQQPKWTGGEESAQALSGVSSHMLFSAIYHSGTKQYFIQTAENFNGNLYEAKQPWGPWTSIGQWFSTTQNADWTGSYMPGIITKDTGPNSFYFASGGSEVPGYTGGSDAANYQFKLGSMTFITPLISDN